MEMLENMGIKNIFADHIAKSFAEMPGINGRPHIAEVEARQGIYLAASSTLTQFNAILTGILGAMLASEQPGILKVTTTFALGLHILATLLLWWAARPTIRRNPISGEGKPFTQKEDRRGSNARPRRPRDGKDTMPSLLNLALNAMTGTSGASPDAQQSPNAPLPGLFLVTKLK